MVVHESGKAMCEGNETTFGPLSLHGSDIYLAFALFGFCSLPSVAAFACEILHIFAETAKTRCNDTQTFWFDTHLKFQVKSLVKQCLVRILFTPCQPF